MTLLFASISSRIGISTKALFNIMNANESINQEAKLVTEAIQMLMNNNFFYKNVNLRQYYCLLICTNS